MPRRMECTPIKLEDQCIYVYLNYLHDEMNLIFHLKNYRERSVLLKQHGLEPDLLVNRLQTQLSNNLAGILQDIVRQKMVDILISTLHTVPASIQDFVGVSKPPPVLCKLMDNFYKFSEPATTSSSSQQSGEDKSYSNSNKTFTTVEQFRSFPRLMLFELVCHKDLKILDFSLNKEWTESSDQIQDMSRTLWKIIGEKCRKLEKFIVPKELNYCNTMDTVISNSSQNLTHLTLKRNVPNNMFLSLIGHNCPNIKELDIAGADVVTDFGVICLIFDDSEQIFLESWHREKTVGSSRRSQKCLPHPHFDKPIPDPTENPQGGSGGSTNKLTNLLHLKRSFYETIMDPSYTWQKLDICNSLKKLRLENTKVKGDGASVVLECCPNVYSLGYLVFAAAGLKQVYGYEDPHETKFTEIFYRGPSDQKLQTIANTCRRLKTMFLGSNSVRRLNASVFTNWPHLEYLTLENIIVEDVQTCLEIIGKQLKGLKIQCAGLDLMELAVSCPYLVSLIIQKECPFINISTKAKHDRLISGKVLFPCLQHLEITCPSFPKSCFNLIASNAPNLKSIKLFEIPGLRTENIEEWAKHLQKLESLIIFKATELDREAVEAVLECFPNLSRFGDFRSFDLRRPADMKKLQQHIKENEWNLVMVESSSPSSGGTHSDEKDFNKLLTLHWFYLTVKKEE